MVKYDKSEPRQRVLLIRTWLGPLPRWHGQFVHHLMPHYAHGWDVLVENDEGRIRQRFTNATGLELPPQLGGRKIGDLDPLFGVMYADVIKAGGYTHWGHVGLDVVLGRTWKWFPDERLEQLDVYGNDPRAICGPFSIYKNTSLVNNLWREVPNYREVLLNPEIQAFDEDHMTKVVQAADFWHAIRFESGFEQSHDKMAHHQPRPKLEIAGDGELWDLPLNREIMMFHFNRKDIDREWPVYY